MKDEDEERDPYVEVSATLIARSMASIRVSQPGKPAGWIPRSLMHAADDLSVDGWPMRREATFRMRKWKAVELGLVDGE